MVCMEGHAFHWMNWLKEKKPDLSWNELREEVLTRFGSALDASPFEELTAVKQTGSIEEYIQDFVAKAAYVPSLPEGMFVVQYLNGLRATIRSRIRPHEAVDLYRTMSISRSIEYEMEVNGSGGSGGSGSKVEEFGLGSKAGQTFWSGLANGTSQLAGRKNLEFSVGSKAKVGQPQSNPQPQTTVGARASQSSNSGTGSRYSTANNRGVRRYSNKEHQELRSKGLCYRCHQPYSPTHRCATSTLHTIVLDMREEGDELEDGANGEVIAGTELQMQEFQRLQLELPLYNMSQPGSNQVLKLKGRIAGREVFVLVDSGASHCFLSRTVAGKLGISVVPTVGMGVKLGDGRREEAVGFCPAVPIDFNSVQVTVDCYVFPLGDVDAVLGVSWLKTLGDIKINWKKMTMEFGNGENRIMMKGDYSLFQEPLTIKSLDRVSLLAEGLILWQSVLEGSRLVDGGDNEAQQEELRQLLQRFEGVF